VHFVKEDASFRRKAAAGKVDFEGVGLNNLYLDVLAVMAACFRSEHQPLLPDQVEVWVKPYLRAMQGFPESFLQQGRYRFLWRVTGGCIVAALLIFAAALSHGWQGYRVSRDYHEAYLVKPPEVTFSEFEAKLASVTIPQELGDKVQLEGQSLRFRGMLTEDEASRLVKANNYEPFTATVGAVGKRLDAAFRANWTWAVLLGLAGAAVVVGRALRHHSLSQHKHVLLTLIEARDARRDAELTQLIRKLIRGEKQDPRLHWLRDAYRAWLDQGGIGRVRTREMLW